MVSPLCFLVGGEFAGLMFQGGAAPISQDAWMWKSPLPPALSDIDFKLGKPGCDNRFAYELRTAGVRVYICTSIYTCIYVYSYNMHMYIYIYIYMYIYTCILSCENRIVRKLHASVVRVYMYKGVLFIYICMFI